MEKIYFMNQGEPEFKRAFQALDDPEARNEEYGEFWQYMGTVKKNGRWVHEFRHRMHPKTKKREYFDVAAKFGWEPAEERLLHWDVSEETKNKHLVGTTHDCFFQQL